ncbi:hypothetical protein GA0115240_12778 [Streptomyces sp. DvalAA-14]|uniref:hypothetical protein n=1 Tax=unclassified Streptomyces TaxID=2593676 RepID=UPI00081B613A|nr:MULTISPECIES: hypothetical protein [unclassified Streptomyces]MYS21210.1 hypothetical protein [Streptomyces sp. SID4948]SCD87008.1 hypothetical protein GA0115240_12778 [Streptomyces sp. DvalAA-14]
MTTAAIRPRLYGYFRLLDGMDDEAIHRARQEKIKGTVFIAALTPGTADHDG